MNGSPRPGAFDGWGMHLGSQRSHSPGWRVQSGWRRPTARHSLLCSAADHFRSRWCSVPVIMVGPGTGIAPSDRLLRSGLCSKLDRLVIFRRSTSLNRHLYEDKFLRINKQASSQSSASLLAEIRYKIYIQHRMLEEGAEIWQWLQNQLISTFVVTPNE